MDYPIDLDERIKQYLKDNNEEWNEDLHHIYIDKTILTFDIWQYKCEKPSLQDLKISPIKKKIKIKK